MYKYTYLNISSSGIIFQLCLFRQSVKMEGILSSRHWFLSSAPFGSITFSLLYIVEWNRTNGEQETNKSNMIFISLYARARMRRFIAEAVAIVLYLSIYLPDRCWFFMSHLLLSSTKLSTVWTHHIIFSLILLGTLRNESIVKTNVCECHTDAKYKKYIKGNYWIANWDDS